MRPSYAATDQSSSFVMSLNCSASVKHHGNGLGRIDAQRVANSTVRRLEPLGELPSEWFVGSHLEEHREVLRPFFAEAALQLALLAPLIKLLLELAAQRSALSCCFVDRDRLGQASCTGMEIS
jgi:hypothetical protein